MGTNSEFCSDERVGYTLLKSFLAGDVNANRCYAGLSPEEQQLLLQCAAEAASWQRAHWQGAEVKAMLRASRSGCYMALLSEEQTELFRDAAQPLYEHLSETQKEVVRRVRALSDESD